MIGTAIAGGPAPRRLLWGALLIGVITFGLYARTLNYPLLYWDDDENILQNPLVLSPAGAGLKQLFTAPFSTDFYPVTYLSLALDHWLWGGRLGGYHFTQNLLHSLNAVLVVLVAWRWTRHAGVALVAGAWFAWHPIQVETVAWLAERKNVLGTALLLLAWLAYLRAEESPAPDRWRLGALAWFILAVLSHALVIVMPALLFCYEICRRRAGFATALRRTWLFFVPAAFAAVMRVLGHGESGQLTRQLPDLTTGGLTMLTVFGDYLNTLGWPVSLSNDYVVRPVTDPLAPGVLGAAAWILLGLVVFWRAPKLRWWAAFAACWFVVALLPVAQLVPHPTLRADRYLYVAALAVFVFVALLLRDRRWLLASLGPVTAVALLALTIVRIPVWRDARVLWADCLRKNPRTPVAHYSLAGWDIHDGHWADAETHLRAAVALNPGFAEAHARLGAVLLAEDNPVEAREQLRRALNLKPDLAEARRNLAVSERAR